jgi:hypothetical protein
MEGAAFMAVARSRSVRFAQLLSAGGCAWMRALSGRTMILHDFLLR